MKSLALTLFAVGALIGAGVEVASAAGPVPEYQMAGQIAANTVPSGLWFFYQDPNRFQDGANFGGGAG
jgi:hypothetical protein